VLGRVKEHISEQLRTHILIVYNYIKYLHTKMVFSYKCIVMLYSPLCLFRLIFKNNNRKTTYLFQYCDGVRRTVEHRVIVIYVENIDNKRCET